MGKPWVLQVHGSAFKHIFGEDIPAGLVGEGFSITDGQLVDRSFTFNTGTPYHDDQNKIHPVTKQLLEGFVCRWKAGRLSPGENICATALTRVRHALMK
jgi:hypothetical protein